MKRGEQIKLTKNMDGEVMTFKGIVTTSRKVDGKYQVLSSGLRRVTGENQTLVKPEDIA